MESLRVTGRVFFNPSAVDALEYQMATKTKSSFDDLPDSAYVRESQIIPDVFPISHASWWRGIKNGRYPPGVKLSENTTAWQVGKLRRCQAKIEAGQA